jgi:hypothetical protein
MGVGPVAAVGVSSQFSCLRSLRTLLFKGSHFLNIIILIQQTCSSLHVGCHDDSVRLCTPTMSLRGLSLPRRMLVGKHKGSTVPVLLYGTTLRERARESRFRRSTTKKRHFLFGVTIALERSDLDPPALPCCSIGTVSYGVSHHMHILHIHLRCIMP